MLHHKKAPSPQELANDIARDIARRGWPGETKALTIHSPFGDAIRWSVIIPDRGVALIDDELHIVVASSNRPTHKVPAFNHADTETDAEQILRNLPLP